MIIERLEENRVRYDSVREGEIIEYLNELFLKINQSNRDNNAWSLDRNVKTTLQPSYRVVRRNFKLVEI